MIECKYIEYPVPINRLWDDVKFSPPCSIFYHLHLILPEFPKRDVGGEVTLQTDSCLV